MPWKNAIIDWRNPESWYGPLRLWIQPYFTKSGFQSLQEMGYQDIYSDDSDWFEILERFTTRDADELINLLSATFTGATVKAYHGCRVADAGVYHRHGLLVNNPEVLADQARKLVNEEAELAASKSIIEEALLEFKHRNHYRGLLYLALDDRLLIERAGQYLLYGSEWILDLLGQEAHEVLKKRGVPTLLHVHLPIRKLGVGDRTDLARALLQEWIRITVNSPEDIPIKDFAFCLHKDIPTQMIVKHTHPEYVVDPYRYEMRCWTKQIFCASCVQI
ncbi:hypothetical protein DYBT9275_03855 [Dyadobacter sp. CECT 9275]|uniref:Uncharacterized protein n=2 Tax=Dyadobacter helix TaxID=2822344 RepID=A0A916NCT5_9BACT|nr:hypothetical protein DYBT9275_03855 [Dyadobacter sp. CECT 9275]